MGLVFDFGFRFEDWLVWYGFCCLAVFLRMCLGNRLVGCRCLECHDCGLADCLRGAGARVLVGELVWVCVLWLGLLVDFWV